MPSTAWQDTEISTVPAYVEMAANATILPSIDFTNALGSGQTVTAASSTLRNWITGDLVADLPTPSVTSPNVTQLIDGADLGLERGTRYALVVVATVTATYKPGRVLFIDVKA